MRYIKLAVAVAAVLLLQGTKVMAGDQDFTIHNKTGVEIRELYISPHSTNDWEENVLGKDSIADGDSLKVTFPANDKTDYWDIQVVDPDGNKVTWEKLKLTEITDVTLKIEHGDPVAYTQNGDE